MLSERTRRDIVERARVLIDEWVQKSERLLSSSDELVINERNDARKNRARAARSGNKTELAAEGDLDVLSWGRDIRERTRGRIE